MTDFEEKVKDILDRGCPEQQGKPCKQKMVWFKCLKTPCWLCDHNRDLAREIAELRAEAKA